VKGRKPHLLVDGLGLVLMVVVHAGNVQEQDGAKRVFERVRGRHPRLRLIWVDAG
jgi:putative transposase